MSADRPDIVLYCGDGHAEYVVQRFRFLAKQGVWIGTKRAAAEIPIYPGDTAESPGFEGPLPERGQWPLRCNRCNVTIPARSERICYVLNALSAARQRRISFKLLRKQLERWPSGEMGSDGLQYPALLYPP